MKALVNIKLLFPLLILLISSKLKAVLIDYNSVIKAAKASCEKSSIEFKKELWESELAEKKSYGEVVGIKNDCLGESDKV